MGDVGHGHTLFEQEPVIKPVNFPLAACPKRNMMDSRTLVLLMQFPSPKSWLNTDIAALTVLRKYGALHHNI